MPEEYLKTRNSIKARCESGNHPGKKDDEPCLKYAKRMAAAIYAKRHGKPPTEASQYVDLIERVEKLLGQPI